MRRTPTLRLATIPLESVIRLFFSRRGGTDFTRLQCPVWCSLKHALLIRGFENPIDGFQRVLDKKRAQDIADYIDKGFGTIPGSIVLSAQAEAQLQYTRRNSTLRFQKSARAFLIIDGQHRLRFKLAKVPLRVPVVIYNGLSRAEEARLFMDINTKQRPVPPELILDIKRLAETESDVEALLRDVYDYSIRSQGARFLVSCPHRSGRKAVIPSDL